MKTPLPRMATKNHIPVAWDRESSNSCAPPCRKLVGGDDELSVGVAAHAVDRAGSASADGVRVAAGMFGRDGYGTICTANYGTFVVKGIFLPEINDETRILGTGREGDGGTDLNAEGLVGLGIRETRFRSGVTSSAAPYVNCAGRRN